MPKVPTTAGEIDAAELGPVLMHEHVFLRTEALQLGWPGFGGWDAEAEVAAARERLRGLSRAGVGAILDMTVPGLYRDPAMVARAAEGTGLKVMCDTGFRAAVLKIVTDEPGMTPDVERLAIAIANVHARTGTPVCTHAHAPSKRGLEQQQILAARGVDLGRVMIGHANETTDLGYLEQIIDNGSYVGWDRCGLAFAVPLAEQLDTLAGLCERGYAGRVMLSHDKASFTDWFTNAEQDFALPDWQFSYIHSALLPGLRERGVTEEQIEQMLVRNPREFFGG